MCVYIYKYISIYMLHTFHVTVFCYVHYKIQMELFCKSWEGVMQV